MQAAVAVDETVLQRALFRGDQVPAGGQLVFAGLQLADGAGGAQTALDQLDALFPAVSGASAQAVVVAPEGSVVTDASIRDQIETLQDALAEVDGVDSVLGPFDEFADGQGVKSLGLEDVVPAAPTPEERSSILDLFRR